MPEPKTSILDFDPDAGLAKAPSPKGAPSIMDFDPDANAQAVPKMGPVPLKTDRQPLPEVVPEPQTPPQAQTPAPPEGGEITAAPQESWLKRKFREITTPSPMREAFEKEQPGALTVARHPQDVLRAPVAAAQSVVHGTAAAAGKAIKLNAAMLKSMEKNHPALTKIVRSVSPFVVEAKDQEQIGQDIVAGNLAAREAEDKSLLDTLGVSKERVGGQIGEFTGEIGGGIAKAAALGPAALPFFSVEGGVDKAVNAIDEGKPLGKALAAGTVSGLSAATLMKMAGGSSQAEKVYDSILKLAVAKARTGLTMGLGFGASDLAIDKYLLGKDVTLENMGKSLLGSVKTMLGYELGGAIPQARLILSGSKLAKEYASPDDARAALVPRLSDTFARFTEASDKERPTIRKEYNDLFSQMQGVAYAEQAKMPFEGKRTSEGAQDIKAALQVADATINPKEAPNAVQEPSAAPEVPRDGTAGGDLVRRGEEVGQGVEGQAAPREGQAQESKAEVAPSLEPKTVESALNGPSWHEIPKDQQEAIQTSLMESSRDLAQHPKETVAKYEALPETRDGRIVNGDLRNLLHPEYTKNANHALGALAEGDVEVLANDAIAMKHIRDAAIDKAVAEGKDAAITVGGQGSGKTTAANKLLDNNPDSIGVVIDAPHNDPRNLEANVRRLLDRGLPVHVVFVDRAPEDAFRSTLTRSFSDVRHVNPDSWVDATYGAPNAAQHIGEVFRNNPKVSLVHLVDGKAIGGTMDEGGKDAYQSIRNRAHLTKEELDNIAKKTYIQEREAGRVPEAIAKFIENTTPAFAVAEPAGGGKVPEVVPGVGAEAEPKPGVSGGAAEGKAEAKVAPAIKPGEKAETPEQVKSTVREVVPDKSERAAIYQSGILGKNPEVEDVVVQAMLTHIKSKDPFQRMGPEVGAINIPSGADIGSVMTRFADRVVAASKALGKESIQGVKNMRNNGVVKLAKALDAQGLIQHAYVKGGETPAIAGSMIGDSPKPKLLPGKDMPDSRLGRHFRSPSFMMRGIFPEGKGPNVDLEIAANDTISKRKVYSDVVKDTLKSNAILDHGGRTDRRMDPIREEIRKVNEKLTPLVKERESLVELRDSQGETGYTEISKRLEEFDKANQSNMEKLIEQKDAAYAKATAEIKAIASDSPDARVALWMEPEAKRPTWLKDMMKPNEIKAAEKLTELMGMFRESGKKLGLRMRNEEYITHLFKPSEMFLYEGTPEGSQLARDILDFHHRQEGSINLMPSVHAAMSYYIPRITHKLAMQPFLNKWYKGAHNDYLDPNSEYYAPKFGKWLENELSAMQHPRPLDIAEKATDIVKQAEITKLLAFNQKTGVKHVVGKITNLIGLHHTYMLPGTVNYMASVARKAENLPLVGKGFKAITGKALDKAHMSSEDAKLVQALMSNLLSSRQIRNALMEDPLVSNYQQPILNAVFGEGKAGSIRGVAQPVINKLTWLKNKAGQPVSAAEALENGINVMASIQRGEAAGLTPEENVRGAIVNLMAYSQRGGHDASKFIKSSLGRAGTALTQTPSKMMELYADIARRGFNGEPDIYGSDGTANMVRAIMTLGVVSYLGEKGGHKLYKMLMHPPLINTGWVSDAAKWSYHSTVGDEREAMLASARMQGSVFGALTTTPVGDILKDIYTIINSPKKFFKSLPAVQQIRSELPEDKGGKIPSGYEDTLHYLTSSPAPGMEERWKALSEKKGLMKIKQDIRKGEQ